MQKETRGTKGINRYNKTRRFRKRIKRVIDA
jgi:hypothetical protein